MDKKTALTIFDTLSSDVRLDIYRLLIAAGPEHGLVAGEIAQKLGLPASNISFHLKTLTHNQLLNVEQQGRYQRYRVNMQIMPELIDFLTAECCSGHPENCSETQTIKRSA